MDRKKEISTLRKRIYGLNKKLKGRDNYKSNGHLLKDAFRYKRLLKNVEIQESYEKYEIETEIPSKK